MLFFIAILSLATIGLSAFSLVRAGGSGDTKCPQCRYDLSGLPTVGVCPECGLEYDGTKSFVPPKWEAHRTIRHSLVVIAMCVGMAIGPLLCACAWYALAIHSHISPDVARRLAFVGTSVFTDPSYDYAAAAYPYFLWMLLAAARQKRTGSVPVANFFVAVGGAAIGQTAAIFLAWFGDALSWIIEADEFLAPIWHPVCFLGVCSGAISFGARSVGVRIVSVLASRRKPSCIAV